MDINLEKLFFYCYAWSYGAIHYFSILLSMLQKYFYIAGPCHSSKHYIAVEHFISSETVYNYTAIILPFKYYNSIPIAAVFYLMYLFLSLHIYPLERKEHLILL